MKIDIQIMSSVNAYEGLRLQWNALVADVPALPLGLDGTSTYEWFEAILDAFPDAAESRVIVARVEGELVGVLPFIINRESRFGPRLLAVTELYGGRSGPLLKEPQEQVFVAIRNALDSACPGWISLQMTLPADGEVANTVTQILTRDGFSGHGIANHESPFFPLLDSAETFRGGVSKSVLQMLRTSRNKFSKIGPLRWRDFTDSSEADELLKLVLSIERQSWKHKAGTSITTQPRQEAFYRALFPRAMKAHLLYAEVLLLHNEPIAYNFGLIHQQVFSCLKHSNVQAYDKLSPSYLLNDSLFEKLRDKGIVTVDWMGLAEPHKLRWSEHNGTYQRDTWVFYNRSLKANLVISFQRQKQRLERLSAHFAQTEQGPSK